MRLLAVLVGLVFSASVEAASVTAEELLDATDDAHRSASSHGTLTMTVKTDRYERTLKMEVWSRGEDASLVRILEPAKERGVSTLKVGNNLWNYLPKVDRTLKVAGAALSGSWMGSHFSNNDLVKQTRFSEAFDFQLTAEPGGDSEVYVVECTAKPDAPVVWGKVVVKVHPDLLPHSVAYYDEKGGLVRTMSFHDPRELGGRTVPARIRVEPVADPGEFTEVVYNTMEFDLTLDDRVFSLQSLKR